MSENEHEPIRTIADCDDDDDVRELIAQEFNNIAVEAMEHGHDPMTVAQATHDHGEKLKIALHSSSARELMSDEQDDSEDTSVFENDETHPLS